MRRKPHRASPRSARACVAGLVYAFVLVSVAPSAQAATTNAEEAVHVMINEARTGSGLAPLNLSDRLSRIARQHSKDMANSGGLFHSCLCGIGGRRLAENVGYGGDYQSVQGQLMQSPPHRANILGRYRRVGVGIVRQGGLAWVTQIFFFG